MNEYRLNPKPIKPSILQILGSNPKIRNKVYVFAQLGYELHNSTKEQVEE